MNRIFVEKKPEFNSEAKHLFSDIKSSLAIDGLQGLRVTQRYDVDGLSDREFAAATRHILSEPQVDTVSADLSLGGDETVFAVEYLPGQFDQRADSAAQCIQILTGKDRPTVFSAKIIILDDGIYTGADNRDLDFAGKGLSAGMTEDEVAQTTRLPDFPDHYSENWANGVSNALRKAYQELSSD